tara:strand:+ start:132 stop:335 length:204 start_codon:yes stop_codon:yes gene_type:complete
MDSLLESYKKAQSELGVHVVLREQFRIIGAKSWTDMNTIERGKLINGLRKYWIKENKSKFKSNDDKK